MSMETSYVISGETFNDDAEDIRVEFFSDGSGALIEQRDDSVVLDTEQLSDLFVLLSQHFHD